MHDLLPDGEDLRKAIKYVSEHLKEDPSRRVGPLVQEAIFKFDLSPRDANFLINFYSGEKSE